MTARIVVLATLLAAAAASVGAQTVIAPVEHLTFDRPESWALQYFTSATLLTGLETVDGEPPGAVTIGLETGWLPSLTAQQQAVGFSGTANEDLNKAPILLRPRVRVALPARLAVMAGGTPPIRTFGVTPRLLALGLEWAMIDARDWRVAWRAHGQAGTVTGAFTCPSSALTAKPGSAANPTGCEAESSDVVTLRYAAIELDAARRLRRFGGLTPHVAVGINDIASRFRVNARTFGFIDHTELETTGVTWSISAGAALPVSSRVTLAADAFYTPLMVRREASGPRTNDGLFNLRGLINVRVF